MKKIFKKTIALLLTFVTVFSTTILPVSAYENNNDTSNLYVTTTENNKTSIMDSIKNTNSTFSSWSLLEENDYVDTVSGLSFTVGFAMLGISTGNVGPAIMLALGERSLEIWASGKFGSGTCLRWNVKKYVRNINPTLGTYELKTENTVYYGPAGNINTYLYSWSGVQTIYSGNSINPGNNYDM